MVCILLLPFLTCAVLGSHLPALLLFVLLLLLLVVAAAAAAAVAVLPPRWMPHTCATWLLA
jgi:hypothetical protein